MATHRFKGLGVLHCEPALHDLRVALVDHLRTLQSTAGHPQLGSATVFACPAGHFKNAAPPFDPQQPSKHIWCRGCAKAVA
eukprot:2603913-Karenia_brevis.AAC.1